MYRDSFMIPDRVFAVSHCTVVCPAVVARFFENPTDIRAKVAWGHARWVGFLCDPTPVNCTVQFRGARAEKPYFSGVFSPRPMMP